VEIDPRVNLPGLTLPIAVQDPQFVNNKVYQMRTSETLAARVLEHLREHARGGAETTAAAPRAAEGSAVAPEPPIPDPGVLRDLDPRSLPGMITVSGVPTTSYYNFSVRGTDPAVCTAVVNGYARVCERVFAEARGAKVKELVDEYEKRLEGLQRSLGEADDALKVFRQREENRKYDFERGRGTSDADSAEHYESLLSTERTAHIQLRRQMETVERALKVAGLSLVPDGGGGFSIPPHEGAAKDDPLLAEAVQALDVVDGSDRVRSARTALEAAQAGLAEIRKRFRPETDEHKPFEARVEAAQRTLARATEAALVQWAEREAAAGKRVKDYETELGKIRRSIEAASVAFAEHDRLRKSAEGAKAAADELKGQIAEARATMERLAQEGGTVRVERYARPGQAPQVAPNLPVIYLTTAVAALLLAAALAYVLEYLDDTVKTREDFDRLVRLPFLGYVPHVRGDGETPADLAVARGKTGSPEVESFRAIRTGIQFSRPDREVRAFLITSAGPGEGKTTVSVNLASAFTGSKGRVLLVDADLRRARVHRALGIDNARGLTNVLVGESSLADAVQRSSVEGLDVLASGPIPPNPAEVLGSERMQDLLREASAKWDRVVIDSPPLVAVTDPALLAKYVDAVFLVISIGKTSIRTIQRARETLQSVGAGIHGAVLNNADVRISGYAESYGGYGYGYGYGYRAREA
jgi:capsular exopolysaccharide synthesis family protein